MTPEERDLLVRAARAAGITLHWPAPDSVLPRNAVTWATWNPRHDDGDALRLAVALRLEIRRYQTVWEVVRYDVQGFARLLIDMTTPTGDPYDATRLAILRAAAAMAPETNEGTK